MKIAFGGRIVVLGSGAVSRCLQPLLLKHLDMDFSNLTVIDFEDTRDAIAPTLEAGGRFLQHRITPENLIETLNTHLQPGDILIDLAWNISTYEVVSWCHDNNVRYINTSVELWDPYLDLETTPPIDRTLYVRHMALRKLAASWRKKGPTMIVEHGANPGLVSHWTKIALEDITRALLKRGKMPRERRDGLERALSEGRYNQLAMLTGTKVIHISERDTQISDKPKRVDEFVNTWSVEGLYEEGIAPAEIGWGTHERRLPAGAQKPAYGPGNQICLSRMGMNTFVRSWVPMGEIMGMVIRHGEAFTLSDHLTVWDGDKPVYRPTVHYAYMPTDACIASLHELKMNNYDMQSHIRIMNDEIIEGRDELGVLLLGHDFNGWWVGSQLDIHETRTLVSGQNATTLQVAASVLGALFWMINHPEEGLKVPDDLPHQEILDVANPYLGPCPSVQTDWTPLKNRWDVDAFSRFGDPRPLDEDIWQFETFLVK
jgi:homospermidine synthase